MRFWRKLSGNQRLLIVGSAAVLAVVVGWPSIKSTIGGIGHQLSRGLIAAARTLDPSGLPSRCDLGPRPRWQPRGEDDYSEAPKQDSLSQGEGDYAEPLGRSLRFPPGTSLGRTGNTDNSPRDRQGRPHHWRYCLDRPGHPQQCGRWQPPLTWEGE